MECHFEEVDPLLHTRSVATENNNSYMYMPCPHLFIPKMSIFVHSAFSVRLAEWMSIIKAAGLASSLILWHRKLLHTVCADHECRQ